MAAARRLAGSGAAFDLADDTGRVSTVPATGGTFHISCDGEQIWERKRDGGFPRRRNSKQRVRDRIDPQRSLGQRPLNRAGRSRRFSSLAGRGRRALSGGW